MNVKPPCIAKGARKNSVDSLSLSYVGKELRCDEQNDGEEFEPMAVKEVDSVILDEQKSSRRSSRRSSRKNSKVVTSSTSKRVISVVEEDEDKRVRGFITSNGVPRVEVIDKNEGMMSDEISSDDT